MGLGDNSVSADSFDTIIFFMKTRSLATYQQSIGKWIHANQVVFLAFFTVAVVAEVFVFFVSSDVRLFFGVLLYWYFVRIGKLSSMRTFYLVLTILLITFFSFLANGASTQTERLAVWFFMFFGFGIVQQWREMAS